MEILIILTWLQIKHWIVDFVLQSNEQVKYKGVYGHPIGITHSLEHVIGTLVALLIASFYASGLYVGWIVLAAVVDGIVHYHIDWLKMNYGNRDITTPQFWNHLGLDQMAHQICYLFLILILY